MTRRRLLNIAVQGTWSLKTDKLPSWIRADQNKGSGENAEVFISVDKNDDEKERTAILQIYRLKDVNRGVTDELVEVKVIQSAGAMASLPWLVLIT